MSDHDLTKQILEQIQNSVKTILERFEPVQDVKDFTDSPWGMEKLDSICMQLIAIGESLKNLDKVTNGELLKRYPKSIGKKQKGYAISLLTIILT